MTKPQPKFAAALSVHDKTEEALAEVIREALDALAAPVDLAMVFVSQHHAPHVETVAKELTRLLGTSNVLGCTGESIIGESREAEDTPAISLWLAHLPQTTIVPMHLEFQRTADGGSIVGWSDELPTQWPKDSCAILLGEPFSFPADLMLERINEDQPGIPVIGGMASGSYQPGENRLILGDRVLESGGVVIYLHGNVRVRTIVSQGCRPIGDPFIITKAERNVIHELGGHPALKQLENIYKTLPVTDQQLVSRGLHIGRVVDEYQSERSQGDFIVRNVVGIEKETGALMIGDYVKPGQTVQFHVRDEFSASAELKQLAAEMKKNGSSPTSVLTFTCNGRGSKLFSEPHHDATCLSKAFGKIPNAGFFAAGEIGPVAGRNFLHGFTASVAVLEPCEENES
ncbi:FIST signal transduction protein [Bremerella sp. T1]|uniref:FIST signal transduction protein n=1 Tax=Bremerella sp. TYQ1 TaxID=3119568 RepID=UPI001CCB15E8|nr:FIST N-terminal domain-containing protein [Bremerella volcania]UBM34623.1 FIST C-terminal domain-containing protein [Bremerella volcania]